MTTRIVILGAGVGGLTVAHELAHCHESNYDIHIYERNATIGGMARSGFKVGKGGELPTEYCWRIYGPNYHNLREILKQIPLNESPDKSVHDNLIDIHNYLIADQQTIFYMNNRLKTLFDLRRAFKKVPYREKYNVLRKILYCFMISTDRLNSMDNMTWKEYVDPKGSLCHDMRKYIIDIMGPFLGAEAAQVNVPSVAKTLEAFKILNSPISVMCGPTNEMWFDHWKKHLETKGVTFHLNSEVADIHVYDEDVKAVELVDGTKIMSDVFFCCMSVESVAGMPSLKIPSITELAKRSYQLMVGVQLYFDKEISLPHKNTAMYIPNSPWQLVIEPQGSIWNKKYDGIGDIWSIGLCDPIRSGLLIKKPFIECSHEEIQHEVWHQIMASELGSYLNLERVQVVDFNVWDSYIFNGNRIDTHEPKFSTNKNTFYLRPDNKTAFNNFHFATAYTKTQTDMFEMESAAESGRRAAKVLEKSVRVVSVDRPLYFAPYRWLDTLIPKVNLFKYCTFLWFCLGVPISIILLPFRFVKKGYNHAET